MEIINTTAGAKVMFRTGDKVDSLTIKEYIGKTPKKNGLFDPLYKCTCKCGNDEIRRQTYLRDKRVRHKACGECGKNRMSEAGMKSNNRASTRDYTLPDGRQLIVEKILDEVWAFRFKPTFNQKENRGLN